MLHLAYTLWSNWTQRDEYKILLVGAEGSGKSVLLEKIKSMFGPKESRVLPLQSIPPTVGLNIARIGVAGRHLVVWDLGGHPKLRSMWLNYYPQCQAIIFAVDGTDPAKVREASSLLRSIFTHPALHNVPVLIASMKADLSNALSAPALLDMLELVDLVLAQPRLYASRQHATGRGEDDDREHESLVKNGAARAKNSHADVLRNPIERAPWFGWEFSEALRGTSGIGSRAYRCVAVSGLTGDGIREGLEWLVEFLTLNARPVETL